MIEKDEGLWKCKVFEKTSKKKQGVYRHAETHIQGVVLPCQQCSKTFLTRHSLLTHTVNIHSNLIFACDPCGESGMNKSAYKNHKARKH